MTLYFSDLLTAKAKKITFEGIATKKETVNTHIDGF